MGAAAMPPLEFETAQEHLCREVPVLSPETAAGQARAGLNGKRFDVASDLAVCAGERLVGLVTIEALLAAPEATAIRDIMDPDPPRVGLAEDQEIAAWKAVQHSERRIAVVNHAERSRRRLPQAAATRLTVDSWRVPSARPADRDRTDRASCDAGRS